MVGFEFASGIPGLIGASIAMNAGAYKSDMASIVKEIKVITTSKFKLLIYFKIVICLYAFYSTLTPLLRFIFPMKYKIIE